MITRIEITPDKEFADKMRKAIRDNDGYCPWCGARMEGGADNETD